MPLSFSNVSLVMLAYTMFFLTVPVTCHLFFTSLRTAMSSRSLATYPCFSNRQSFISNVAENIPVVIAPFVYEVRRPVTIASLFATDR